MTTGYLASMADDKFKEVIAIFQGTTKVSEPKDCQAAAMNLGAMCHFIADATFYPHLITGADGSRSGSLLHRANLLTSRKYSNWPTGRGGSFLSIDSARTQFGGGHTVGSGSFATQCAGWDTFSGTPYNQPDAAFKNIQRTHIKDTSWLNQHDFPEITPGDSDQYWDWRADDWSSFQSGTDEYAYLKTIEHNLNVAIYYTATAMNKAMDYYEDCKCDNAKEEESGKTTLTNYLQYSLLFTMLTISSLLTSIFALSWYGVSSKIK